MGLAARRKGRVDGVGGARGPRHVTSAEGTATGGARTYRYPAARRASYTVHVRGPRRTRPARRRGRASGHASGRRATRARVRVRVRARAAGSATRACAAAPASANLPRRYSGCCRVLWAPRPLPCACLAPSSLLSVLVDGALLVGPRPVPGRPLSRPVAASARALPGRRTARDGPREVPACGRAVRGAVRLVCLAGMHGGGAPTFEHRQARGLVPPAATGSAAVLLPAGEARARRGRAGAAVQVPAPPGAREEAGRQGTSDGGGLAPKGGLQREGLGSALLRPPGLA